MPYKLSGTSVVKADSGEVLKTHPTREKALAHLRALKANVSESDGAGVLGALLEGFSDAKHPRDRMGRWIATFAHPVHGRVTSPITARSTAEAASQARARKMGTLQSLVPHDEAAKAIGKSEGPARAGELPSQQPSDAQLHSRLTTQLENLPQGRYHSLPGIANGGAIARKTTAGVEVYRAGEAKPARVHKTPSAAAGHMMRIRKAGVIRVGEASPGVLGALMEGQLSAKRRSKLPKSAFAIPETESYPIHDEAHARNALSRVAQHGSPDEQRRVRAAVKRRYPHIGGK